MKKKRFIKVSEAKQVSFKFSTGEDKIDKKDFWMPCRKIQKLNASISIEERIEENKNKKTYRPVFKVPEIGDIVICILDSRRRQSIVMDIYPPTGYTAYGWKLKTDLGYDADISAFDCIDIFE